MGFLVFVGRLLIATAIISSAYLHYQQPIKSVSKFQANYKAVDALSDKYLEYDIPFDNTSWNKVVKLFGGFEAVVAFLIIFGDSLGGIIYLITLVVETLLFLLPKILTKSIVKFDAWRPTEKLQLSRLVCLIGITLIILTAISKQAKKVQKPQKIEKTKTK